MTQSSRRRNRITANNKKHAALNTECGVCCPGDPDVPWDVSQFRCSDGLKLRLVRIQKEVILLIVPSICRRQVRPASAILHQEKCVRRSSGLLHLEGQAVSALTYGGISFVSSYLYLVMGAVILAAAVVLAVVDSTANMLVCKFSSHYDHSFLIEKCGLVAAHILSAEDVQIFLRKYFTCLTA